MKWIVTNGREKVINAMLGIELSQLLVNLFKDKSMIIVMGTECNSAQSGKNSKVGTLWRAGSREN